MDGWVWSKLDELKRCEAFFFLLALRSDQHVGFPYLVSNRDFLDAVSTSSKLGHSKGACENQNVLLD